MPPPGVRAGHHRLAAVDRCRQGPAAAQAGDYLQDRGRGSTGTRRPSGSGISSRRCRMRCSSSLRPTAPPVSRYWRSSAGRSRRLEERDESPPDHFGHPDRSCRRLEPRARSATLAWVGVPLRQHDLRAGAACERLADGEPDQLRRDGHPAGTDAERRVAEHDQAGGRREPGDQQVDDRHDGVGRVGNPVARSRGSRWLCDRRGKRTHQHRSFGLRRSRGGPHLLRPAGGRRNGQHEIPRHLQRRRRPHAVWRVQHRGRRPVRRTCDDDVAIGVQDFDILRSLLLHLRRHVLPALYVWRRPLLLSRSATLLLVLQLPASRRDHSHDSGRQVPGVAGRQLLQADDDQRRKDDVPGGARAAGRHDADVAGDARARERQQAPPTISAPMRSTGA